jgi:hypothetical protein
MRYTQAMRLLKPDLEKYIIFILLILEMTWESGKNTEEREEERRINMF